MYKRQATDEELKNYYEEFKNEFSEPESRSASHILVDNEAKAKDIKAKIDKGEDFASLAKEQMCIRDSYYIMQNLHGI